MLRFRYQFRDLHDQPLVPYFSPEARKTFLLSRFEHPSDDTCDVHPSGHDGQKSFLVEVDPRIAAGFVSSFYRFGKLVILGFGLRISSTCGSIIILHFCSKMLKLFMRSKFSLKINYKIPIEVGFPDEDRITFIADYD